MTGNFIIGILRTALSSRRPQTHRLVASTLNRQVHAKGVKSGEEGQFKPVTASQSSPQAGQEKTMRRSNDMKKSDAEHHIREKEESSAQKSFNTSNRQRGS